MMNNRTVFPNGVKLLLWAVSRQRSRKWMLLSFLGYVGILYGVFAVGGARCSRMTRSCAGFWDSMAAG